jgi:YggT family protein
MQTLYFLANSVFSFAVYAFLLRVLLQVVRADFRNPLAQAVVSLTNWLVLPLRRILPPIGRFDTASLVALLGVQFAATFILMRYWPTAGQREMPIEALRSLAHAALMLYTILVFVYAALSFVAPGARSPATTLLASLCEPLLRPIRRIVPAVGGLDFSPLVAIVGLTALRILIS